MRGDAFRFWFPVVMFIAFAGYCGQKLFRTHLDADIATPRYDFSTDLTPMRGAIYDSTTDMRGRPYPLVKSTPCWEYRLDPVAMTNAKVRAKGQRNARTLEAQARTISHCLGLDYEKTLEMCRNTRNRYQRLAVSDDQRVHDILTDTRCVAGVIANDIHRRHYFEGRRLSHVLGGVNAENDGSSGMEQRFNKLLRGVPGELRGKRDGRGRILWDKSIERTPAIPGADIYLTVNHLIQFEAECALAEGIERYGAAEGWCVVLDAATGEVLALASHPDFDPLAFGSAPEKAKLNRVTAFTYEPGSVMKVITAAAAIDAGFVTPDARYSTARKDDRYYKLPGDGSHVWEPTMTLTDAIVHSSNIVIGKLGYDFGPIRLYAGMARFGFGRKTGIELPGEEMGIVRDPKRRMWDKATWSRAAIGQGVSVTAIQLASAYQAIANDGVRIPPRIVRRVLDADGNDILDPATRVPPGGERVISAETARKVRQMMLGVASPAGTARRAAIRGYSVAGKTGTAQKVVNGRYAPGLYRATFCGIVPSGVVKRNPYDAQPVPPRVVILVSLDFDEKRKYHQGGNSAGPIFKRIAQGTLRCLEVEPDRPDEIDAYEEDEFDKIVAERAKAYAEEDPEWDGDLEWMNPN